MFPRLSRQPDMVFKDLSRIALSLCTTAFFLYACPCQQMFQRCNFGILIRQLRILIRNFCLLVCKQFF